jgi:TolB-like protein
VERAARLYRGPFLDGFYVSDAPEFERWAEGERDRLARAYVRALECLAAACETSGSPQDAAGWWRMLAVRDPYNSRVGARLMRALDLAGERAAALWFAEAHTALLREELGVEPEPEFAALVERLRTEPVRLPPAPAAAPPPAPRDAGPFPAVPPPRGEGNGVPGDSTLPVPPPHPEAFASSAASETGGATPPAADDSSVPDLPSPDPPPPAAAAGRSNAAVPSPSPEVVPRGPAKGRGRWRRTVYVAGMGGMLAGLAAGLMAAERQRPAAPPAPAGNDPRRIAVLYFDDNSRGSELQYLADGLTEALIHDLSQVEALEVVSRNGVKPYRDAPVRFGSLVDDLKVGSVVEGSVQRSGDSVRVTVQLIDAATHAHLESRTIVHPLTHLFALEDTLAGEVSAFLRRRLGRQVALRRTRAETTSNEAWALVQRAGAAREEEERLAELGDTLSRTTALELLARADSLLARAERADPAWARPTVLRGWVDQHRTRWVEPARRPALEKSALRRAARVLAREPGNAGALELHGGLLFVGAVHAPDRGDATERLERAERELRAAVAADPSLATAWATLSQLVRYRGRFGEGDLAARRALEEDAWLKGADDIMSGLFFSALLLGDLAEARSACGRGAERFPRDWRFAECRLTLLREDRSHPADPAQAARLLAELDRLDPPEQARAEQRAYTPAYRLAVAAAVLARAGNGDSARALLARAVKEVGNDRETRLSLDYDAVFVRLQLGERAWARALLDSVLAARPELRPFAARDPLLGALLGSAAATGSTREGDGTPSRPGA